MAHLLEGLTTAQREAVQHLEGPLLILAGPGSGKTRVVTHRIGWLLSQGVPASEILALTFTNKAAEEMKSRVERLAPDENVWVGTYHRFCARMLRRYAAIVGLGENYTIYDTEDSRRSLRRTISSAKLDLTHCTPDQIGAAISWAKNRLISAERYQPRPGHPLGAIVKRIYPAYQQLLTRSNAADFDDLLLHLATILRENPEVRKSLDDRYRFILVDEYQDTNLAQYAIARALSIDYPNLAVTGDPDQSIYGWRGANIQNILEFEENFPQVRVVRLEQNYRSTKRILAVAAELISHNVHRKQKDLYTENGDGAPVRLTTYSDHKEEARGIAARIADEIHAGARSARDYAIFYRINALSRSVELALREHGIPYQLIRGLEFFQRKEIKDVLSYLQLLNNPRDDNAVLRVINTPPRGIGKTTIGRLIDHSTRHGISLLDAARRAEDIDALSRRSGRLVEKFVQLYDRLDRVADSPAEEIVGFVLAESGYKAQFEKSDVEEDAQRLANIEELLTVARDFDERYFGEHPLEGFLEETSLVADTDDWEGNTDRVTLMTLHASKGLEFPVVYLIAVEESLLPHERSRESTRQLEEERRLMFVGLTRARQELQISRASYRDFRGQRKMTVPSRFLIELPRTGMELSESDSALPGWVETEPRCSDEVPWEDPPASDTANTIPAEGVFPARSSAPAARPIMNATLTTAAEMTEGVASSPVDPDEFRQGMLVRHPVDGLGRIVALSGSGPQRKASVDFATAGRKKFLLAESPLRPVKK